MGDHLTIGVLAHVDAGKTTLIEAMLHTCGVIRKAGRVDHGDSYLDSNPMERSRGITIFSKQAIFEFGNHSITLIDTPGHVDFSSEAERVLSVLDLAVLVISGNDGVQSHTETLWELLYANNVPTVIFVNKTDMDGFDRSKLLNQLRNKLSAACVEFIDNSWASDWEDIAMGSESAMEEYLESDSLSVETLRGLFAQRQLFPVLYGSALKEEGVEQLLELSSKLATPPQGCGEFGAIAYKISRDSSGSRLTWLKVTGGKLKVKSIVGTEESAEKVDQIRLYTGEKFALANEVSTGQICAVTGLKSSYAGKGYGNHADCAKPLLEPALSYKVILPEGCDDTKAFAQLKILDEEDPMLQVSFDEDLREMRLSLMGEIQLEVVAQQMLERFNQQISFGPGSVLYKEVIESPVVGIGHFEPLRHYAESQILLEPLPLGSGLEFATACSEDVLDLNWQRLIWQHFIERTHKGVLTGSPVTDLRMTILTGRAHAKHTNGGDFRQATYRAIRQGLMKAKSHLLEPWYAFNATVPSDAIGRLMADVQRKGGSFEAPAQSNDIAMLAGSVPVSEMSGYPLELNAYTRGQGRITLRMDGYKPCHNEQQVIAERAYDPESDLPNTPDSVFCSHGAGYTVKWDEVDEHAHMEHGWYEGKELKYRFEIY